MHNPYFSRLPKDQLFKEIARISQKFIIAIDNSEFIEDGNPEYSGSEILFTSNNKAEATRELKKILNDARFYGGGKCENSFTPNFNELKKEDTGEYVIILRYKSLE